MRGNAPVATHLPTSQRSQARGWNTSRPSAPDSLPASEPATAATHPRTAPPAAAAARRRPAALLLMAATAVTLALLLALAGGPWAVLGGPLGSHSLLDREAGAADVGVSAAALDMARLRPVKKWFAGHNIYYQNALDGKAKGLLIMFHKCGRSGRWVGRQGQALPDVPACWPACPLPCQLHTSAAARCPANPLSSAHALQRLLAALRCVRRVRGCAWCRVPGCRCTCVCANLLSGTAAACTSGR